MFSTATYLVGFYFNLKVKINILNKFDCLNVNNRCKYNGE